MLKCILLHSKYLPTFRGASLHCHHWRGKALEILPAG
ncbi:predicted protein [Plenodomus lingam JN3]|uniref:Predicted protein n=1 Tax=Leptosphaeria maculans (strain JN3 / isolate v23.1.3 / race Av1-4-5-6-7-8) TaxID=985895 RepID=E4ZVB5_LEPMJ|nr:predicted protein [Plenodomus lingam JN3]CBX95541.1 predicted protein [Plenodomus lingam JN3]